MCTVLSIAKGSSLSGLLQFQQSKMVYRSFQRLPSLQSSLLKTSGRSDIGLNTSAVSPALYSRHRCTP